MWEVWLLKSHCDSDRWHDIVSATLNRDEISIAIRKKIMITLTFLASIKEEKEDEEKIDQ